MTRSDSQKLVRPEETAQADLERDQGRERERKGAKCLSRWDQTNCTYTTDADKHS